MSQSGRKVVLKMSGDDLIAGVCDGARLWGWKFYHIRRSDQALVQGEEGIGFPDITFAHDEFGHAFVEAKGTGDRVRQKQKVWLNTLARHDSWVAVWTPEHYDAALEWLRNPIEFWLEGRPIRREIPGRWRPAD